jgi:hypothetical protein
MRKSGKPRGGEALTGRAVPRHSLHALVLYRGGLCPADEEAEHAQLAHHFVKRPFSDKEFLGCVSCGRCSLMVEIRGQEQTY